MTRLFEFIVALIMVAILGVVVGVFLPPTGHVQRSQVFNKNIRDVYDLFNNFRRFPDYAVLRAYDPQMVYKLQGKSYGPGAGISWTSNNPKVGNGSLTVASAKPGYENVEDEGQAEIVWDIKNDWHGTNKQFTIDLKRTGRQQNLVDVTWAYDVDYGWNLLNRYSGLYIHGDPDSLIQYSLDNLQNLLAEIPNIDYSNLNPVLVDRPQQPVLFVSTSAKRSLADVADATDAAVQKLHDAMKKLGVKQAGPLTTFTTNFGDTHYYFDVALPIDTSTLKIDGKEYQLTPPKQAKLDNGQPGSSGSAANAGTAAGASSVAAAGSAPASASSSAGSDNNAPKLNPGDRDKKGNLVINDDVRGMLAFGGRALKGVWKGSAAGIPPTRLMLEAYALTHGYHFDDVTHREYDQTIPPPAPKEENGKGKGKGKHGKKAENSAPTQSQQPPQTEYDVYLPVSWAPKATPVQEAAAEGKGPLAQPAPAGSAPAPAGSAPAPAGSAPAGAGSASGNQ